jgi:hypothetical protein
MSHPTRFARPLDLVRTRGTRLLEAYSPKLARRVQHIDRASFLQWVRLEADPEVTGFCERPARLGREPASRPIGFWVERGQAQEFVVLSDGSPEEDLPAEHEGTPLRVIAPAELAAHGVWIANWQRMLPVVTTTRSLMTTALKRAVLTFVDAPMPLSRIEREHAAGDPMLVRGAVFELLRTGALAAPSLHTQPLALGSMIEPVR